MLTLEWLSRNTSCSQEVILAARGRISLVLLQVPGIRPAESLQPINATIKINLPGVGNNFQGHGMANASYRCELWTSGSAMHCL